MLSFCKTPRMGSIAESDYVHTGSLHFQEQNGKDQSGNAQADVTCNGKNVSKNCPKHHILTFFLKFHYDIYI